MPCDGVINATELADVDETLSCENVVKSRFAVAGVAVPGVVGKQWMIDRYDGFQH